MIDAILHNPYRILGVYSNSSLKEQIANKDKLQAFIKVKKSMSFPADMTPLLPPLQRTNELVNEASAKLASIDEQMKCAFFWFINKTPVDRVAFNHLINGNIKPAREVWSKVTNMSSLQNQFVLELICFDITNLRTEAFTNDYQKREQIYRELRTEGLYGSIEEAINEYAIPLYNEYIDELAIEITDNRISQPDYMRIIIDTLLDYAAEYIPIDRVDDDNWAEYLKAKKSGPIIKKIEESISKAQQCLQKKSPSIALEVGNLLKQATVQQLDKLSSIIGEGGTHYQLIADKVAMCIIDCMVAYYNITEDIDKAAKALPLCDYAYMVAKGVVAKNRAEENRDVVKSSFDNQTVSKYLPEIDELFSWLNNQYRSSKNALQFINKAEPLLDHLKTELGKYDKEYVKISSDIADAALNYVIAELNYYIGECNDDVSYSSFFSSYPVYSSFSYMNKKGHIKNLARIVWDAWDTILAVGKLDMSMDTRSRYSMNKEKLKAIKSEIENNEKKEYYSVYGSIGDKPYSKNSLKDRLDDKQTQESRFKKKLIIRFGIIFVIIASVISLKLYKIYNDRKEEKTVLFYEHKGLLALNQFALDNSGTAVGDKAEIRVEEICDSLYAIAFEENTKCSWIEYRGKVPHDYYYDSEEKLKGLYYSSEASAWEYADSLKTIEEYKRYLNFYPNGMHSDLAKYSIDKTLVDNKVNEAFNESYGDLPLMNRRRSGGATSIVSVANDSRFKLILYFSGIDSKSVEIEQNAAKTIKLKNGKYRIAAFWGDSTSNGYICTQDLQGGIYDVEYYITH